jgi:hypothetical protein
MHKLIIYSFLFFITLHSFCQKNSIDITGTWQFKTSSIGSGYLDNYKFDSNQQTFEFNTNEYNGLNRILSIGGKYEIQGDTILFYVQYTLEYVGGYPGRSKTTTLSDSWELIDGKIEINDIKNREIIEKARISKNLDDEKRIECLIIDDRTYYNINID